MSPLPQKYVKKNHLKRLRENLLWCQKQHDLYQTELYFLLWCYDLEFWTLDFASKDYGMYKDKLADRIVYPMVREGYLYKHFEKKTLSECREDHLFREETKYNYRVRYALSQKGRLMVQRFYNRLES
tara:strand:- start:162 stop:542 length:381 start_codon:yes stop_codon:yes gene_type:complete